MEGKDVDLLFLQIKNIIFNKPISEDLKIEDDKLEDLQKAIEYLSNCMAETNKFLTELAAGNLDIQTPSRHNFLAGALKELHSGLKHLTWQANQVANGNYNQRVGFLGEFSNAFNTMIEQLEERENKLKSKTIALTQSIDLMVSIMDSLQEWIVVTEKKSGDIIYVNQSAKILFEKIDKDKKYCSKNEILSQIVKFYDEDKASSNFEFQYEYKGRFFNCKSFLIQWNEKIAYVHFIADITSEFTKKEHLENIAFKDELTGTFNRRYCLNAIHNMLNIKENFSIAMIDIDGLKTVNDTLGHLEGDEYIKIVSEEIVFLARDTDIICRIGGDEFIVILPNCKKEILEDKLYKLNRKLYNYNRGYDMSISYGVMEILEDISISAGDILEQIDERMYRFKKSRKKERKI